MKWTASEIIFIESRKCKVSMFRKLVSHYFRTFCCHALCSCITVSCRCFGGFCARLALCYCITVSCRCFGGFCARLALCSCITVSCRCLVVSVQDWHCVLVLLSVVDVWWLLCKTGIQQVSGSTPTAIAVSLFCLCLSLSFQSSHNMLFCGSVSTA
jgi:hypothetical protein